MVFAVRGGNLKKKQFCVFGNLLNMSKGRVKKKYGNFHKEGILNSSRNALKNFFKSPGQMGSIGLILGFSTF